MTVHGDVDHKCVAIHPCQHVVGADGGFLTNAIVLDECAHGVATGRPVLKRGDALQGIGQLADDG